MDTPPPTTRPAAGDLVCVAVVAAAHGIRGALRLRCFTEDPRAVAAYGPLRDRSGGRALCVRVIGEAKGGVIVAVEGVDDRDAAEAMRGLELFVPRAALPALEEDEYYHADLVGLAVHDREGRPVGRVVALWDFGAGELLEIATDDNAVIDLPFTRDAVPKIDLAAGLVVVDIPETLRPRVRGKAGPARDDAA